MVDHPAALVLSWNAYGLEVLCPFECKVKIHRHPMSYPYRVMGESTAPCKAGAKYPEKYKYRFLFPFVNHPLTKDLWWKIGIDKYCWHPILASPQPCWKTVGWWIDNPCDISQHKTTRFWYYMKNPGLGVDLVQNEVEFEDEEFKEEEGETGIEETEKEVTEKEVTEKEVTEKEVTEKEQTEKEETKKEETKEDEDEMGKDGENGNADSGTNEYGGEVSKRNDEDGDEQKQKPLLDELESAFEALDIQAPKLAEPEATLETYCFMNDVKNTRKMLEQSQNPRSLIDDNPPGSTPIIVAVCQNGFTELLDLLLEYSPHLDARNSSGETALMVAVQKGFGRISKTLARARADVNIFDTKGRSLVEVTRRAVQLKTRRRLRKIGMLCEESHTSENGALIEFLKYIEALEESRAELYEKNAQERLANLHGKKISNMYLWFNRFDYNAAITSQITTLSNIPTSSSQKTVACLIRGVALPYKYAVSGYSPGPYAWSDGTLSRPYWTKRVMKLARDIGHDLPADSCDGDEGIGSYYACHAEKQLLAFLIWNHTAAMMNSLEGGISVNDCQPPLRSLQADIIIWQADETREARVCSDCEEFLQKAADAFDLSLRVHETFRTQVSHKLIFTKSHA